MRAADIKTIKYKDNLAAKRRQRFMVKTSAIAAAVLVVVVGLGYALFFSPWLVIRNVSIDGLNADHAQAVQSILNQHIARRFLGVPLGRNEFFFSSGHVEAELLSQFSFLQNVSVSKKYPHQLVVNASERQAEGIWCFDPPQGRCRYFDRNGVIWGDAVQSTGYLLLDVDDMRIRKGETLDKDFLTAIQTVVKGLARAGLKIKNVTIPEESFTEFDVAVDAGYQLKFALDSNIANQLKAFQAFKQKQLDTGLAAPQYLDLRYDGRVYFK